jgi:hypothetical protein
MMNDAAPDINTPLISGVSQFEVDFVIPRVGKDLPIGIDPFLLFKSREPQLSELHSLIVQAFNRGIEYIRNGDPERAAVLFDFPEVEEIGFGYAEKNKKGSGVGTYLRQLIIETITDSPALQERGLRHIEEMQLVSLDIAQDRTSDIAANLLKEFLIDYTQKQCGLWDIQLVSGAPVNHIFDFESATWYDGYFDLPVSPVENSPILFVPRRIVRALPWINYQDFFRMEFSAYLRAKRVKGHLATKSSSQTRARKISKEQAIAVARKDIERIDRYVAAKEASSDEAQPGMNYLDTSQVVTEADTLKSRLAQLEPGTRDAGKYQRVVLEILNFLFSPELINGELEAGTVEGTERRDIIFTNDSDQTFWSYLRTEHSSFLIMFEVKNTKKLDNFYFNQVSTYLGDRLGRLGFIVTRHALEEAQEKKAFSIYNDSTPRKIILTLSDADMCTMIDMKCQGSDPMRHIQGMYRSFRTRVQ